MSENRNSDEIDLIQLLLKISKTLEKNLVLITSFFLVGCLLGFFWYSNVQNIYESKMLLTSEVLTEPNSKELIETLNDLNKEGSITELAKKLNLSTKDAKAINHIEIESVDKKSEPVKENEKTYLKITVRVTDQSILPDLQKKLIGYLENNDFVKIRVQQKKEYYTSLIKKANEEIIGLEEFKTKIYKGDFFSSMKGNVMFDPTVVNTKILDLSKEKIEYEQSLVLVNSIQVVDGFTVFENPVSPKLSVSLASGAFIGLVFVVVLLAFKGLRKLARMEANPK